MVFRRMLYLLNRKEKDDKLIAVLADTPLNEETNRHPT